MILFGDKKQKAESRDLNTFVFKSKFVSRVKSLLGVSEIKPGFWDDLEELLLTSDVGLETTSRIIEASKGAKTIVAVKEQLSTVMRDILKSHRIRASKKPHVIMVVGVNGTGKTTSIAKLAQLFKEDEKKVMLVAADTFRAAAIEQLNLWGNRLGVNVVAQKQDSDPAAVAYDGVNAAKARDCDFVILDTAGRLHTKKNLMDELVKVKRVVGKALPGAPHDILLVLDATVGQNGLAQAKVFHEVLGLSGLILAKMDGTAKGGIVFAISNELGLPVSFIGMGETINDLKEFKPEDFVREILE